MQLRSFFASREFDELASFSARRRQRLFTKDVLAGLQRFERDRRVLCVRSADVHRVDGRVVQDSAVVGVRAIDSKGCSETLCRIKAPSRNCSDVYSAHPPNSFQMNASHESGTNNCSA